MRDDEDNIARIEHPNYNYSYAAYSLGFGRDDYEDIELPPSHDDKVAREAWQMGWDAAHLRKAS